MIKENRLENIDIEVSAEDLTGFNKQKAKCDDMNIICAGTILYQYELLALVKLIPDEGKINAFHNKEVERLKNNQIELDKLEVNLLKKIESRNRILDQVASQTLAAKLFR